MAFSSRFGKAKAAPAASPAADFATAPPRAAEQDSSSYDGFTRRQEEDAKREAYEQEKARQATIAKSRAEAARRAMRGIGTDEATAGKGGYPAQAESGTGGFGWKKRESAAQGGLSFGRGATTPSSAPAKPERRMPASTPSHDICEQAISAMISRTHNGMKEGLQMLGLPDYPLSFVPGRELVLCGHSVREEVNEMIHNWMTDEKEDFAQCLARIKDLVSKPILTEEELDMVDNKAGWKKIVGSDGKVQFQQRQPGDVEEDDDDDDDEVIDLDPAGARVPPSGQAANAPSREDVNWGFASSSPKAAEPPPFEEDYYALLGVDPAAPLHEIRTKFRALVLTAHPEKGGDATHFHLLNKAYGVLSDQKKRDEYDRNRR
eukprot:TRINITY_DN592_c0_g1_i4.p1 TRINITY_DN592_c0_g1~~TRINITY_DN592_c0_g1_i4.p1  ORF type:complete len:376 (-),score=98.65 TRINITY_DN592_c0_g1_i4:52-1179(-)